MSGLTLTLKPREKFLVGGLMVENGPRRSSIRIEDDNVYVLRLSDTLSPEEVNTPLKRAYQVAQRVLACEVSAEEGVKDLEIRLRELLPIFVRAGQEDMMVRLALALSEKRFFGVLMGLRNLFPVEEELLKLAELKTAATAQAPTEKLAANAR